MYNKSNNTGVSSRTIVALNRMTSDLQKKKKKNEMRNIICT
jgi:hypothetical protein